VQQPGGKSKKKITAINVNLVDPAKLSEQQLSQMTVVATKQQYDPTAGMNVSAKPFVFEPSVATLSSKHTQLVGQA
jgi:hypothetical protein